MTRKNVLRVGAIPTEMMEEEVDAYLIGYVGNKPQFRTPPVIARPTLEKLMKEMKDMREELAKMMKESSNPLGRFPTKERLIRKTRTAELRNATIL